MEQLHKQWRRQPHSLKGDDHKGPSLLTNFCTVFVFEWINATYRRVTLDATFVRVPANQAHTVLEATVEEKRPCYQTGKALNHAVATDTDVESHDL
jgi:hypothetical protein